MKKQVHNGVLLLIAVVFSLSCSESDPIIPTNPQGLIQESEAATVCSIEGPNWVTTGVFDYSLSINTNNVDAIDWVIIYGSMEIQEGSNSEISIRFHENFHGGFLRAITTSSSGEICIADKKISLSL